MKKIISITIIITLLMGSLSTFSFGSLLDSNFIDVKVGANINGSTIVKLSSSEGFEFYYKNNKGNNILELSDNELHISKRANEIEIFNIYDEYITTLPGDGSIIIGSLGRESVVKVEENRYRDYITFLVRGNDILLINHIDLDNYLYGVVPKEIPASAEIEALKAQAVVARSYALSSLSKHISEGYNLCDTVHCQVYGAMDNEKPSTNQAVDQTKGEYVTYNGQIANTPFHSTSGGYTEDSSKVWGGELPYLVAVEDHFSSNSPHSSWSIRISPNEIRSKLGNAGIYIGEVLDMEVIKVSDANRVQEIKITGSLGETTLSGEKLRGILGTTYLKSAWFEVEKEGANSSSKTAYVLDGNSNKPIEINLDHAYIIGGNKRTQVSRNIVSRAMGSNRTGTLGGSVTSTTPTTFVLNGKGYGHGVGMSQYGAMEMAKQGYNYYDIIKHYYRGVEISNIYD